MAILFTTTLAFLFGFITLVAGHGRLMVPPARNAMWRFGFRNPVNYNDNELYCGGFVVQYQENKGKCGVCGDDFREKVPRSHEAGGMFANGIIGERYIIGQEIEVEAELTTNHYGKMLIELCPNNDPSKIVEESCFDQYPLQLADGSGTYFIIPQGTKKSETFRWKVKLPDGVSCNHCVIRWTYFTGNTWGECADGSESVGCGVQETFINCADVAIYVNTPAITSDSFNPWAVYLKSAHPNMLPPSRLRLAQHHEVNSLKPLVVRAQVCLPLPEFREVPGMIDWCKTHCLSYPPHCPEALCKCVYECDAVGEFALRDQADIWCHQNCLKATPYCPATRCSCI